MKKKQGTLWKTFYSLKLNYKKIYIENGSSMEEWIEDNKDVVLNSLYDSLAEFIDSDEATRLVLKLIIKPSNLRGRIPFDGMAFEFMLVKNELEETMEGLLNHFVETEEYEKCAQIVKLQKRHSQLINKSIIVKPIKKRKTKKSV